MFPKNYREVPGIASKDKQHWQLNINLLAELAKGHKTFLEEVQECFEENRHGSWLYNIKVFSFESRQFPADPPVPWIAIAFRLASSVAYFACCADGLEDNFVVEGHYNQTFIAQMAEMF